MRTAEFDFPLPEELIASEPLPERDSSRLMVLRREGDGDPEHLNFSKLPGLLDAGDLLVLNRTKVLPMRLRGTKRNGLPLEILLIRNLEGKNWEVMSKGQYTGRLEISDRINAHLEKGEVAELDYEGDLRDILWADGEMPLPPYIKRRAHDGDKGRYQTVYATQEGSIAAPTAGLHFTPGLIRTLEDRGVLVRYLTLHVGKGTFTPVRAESLDGHEMEREFFDIDRTLLEDIEKRKGRLVAVGTTSTRALEGFLSGQYEAAESSNGMFRGSTSIFIHPGYRFRAVDALLTNFHLPRSTPLMLASAFCGRKKLLHAYSEAVSGSYRFFSYGDAMLIL
jgi:S-adenosylmethionine:tRNA ribosyltransferase-isomerase